MIILLEPKTDFDDAKFTLSEEEITQLSDIINKFIWDREAELVPLEMLKVANLVWTSPKSLTEGKLIFCGQTYFQVQHLLFNKCVKLNY